MKIGKNTSMVQTTATATITITTTTAATTTTTATATIYKALQHLLTTAAKKAIKRTIFMCLL
jgi:hypothetical protein